jgi:hypothetical protein
MLNAVVAIDLDKAMAQAGPSTTCAIAASRWASWPACR